MVKVPWVIIISIFSGFFIAGVIYLNQVQPAAAKKRIRLQPSPTELVSLPQHTNKLRIAVGEIISPAKSLTFYEDIFDYI